MTQEEKFLLLQDLSARLPYGVVVNYNGLVRPLFGIEPTQYFQITLDNALDGEHNGLVYVSLDVDSEEPKPYLRPLILSSMTEEEKKERNKFVKSMADSKGYTHYIVFPHDSTYYTDWLNANHFDYRGLIEKNLALDCTGLHIYD